MWIDLDSSTLLLAIPHPPHVCFDGLHLRQGYGGQVLQFRGLDEPACAKAPADMLDVLFSDEARHLFRLYYGRAHGWGQLF
ncbi:hypothetical protein HNR46_000188 [Haloferula luteola]|uniref:Uncharacterized protein n=1 Tax=Haloferula luteola TaxID=595692 RepID=A0A840UUU1_9BACT|nr:hypothetical protein [Haloferula luteola]MBB5349967.1 hypothetical protein [Haloferula luteola]